MKLEKDYFKAYEGRDEIILNKHAEDTILEDISCFDNQLENHFAHVLMLTEQGIITKEVGAKIINALKEVKELGPDKIEYKPGLTDLYSNIEEWLINKLGIDVGGRVHTGRSRNDMNSTIERQHTRETILDLLEAMSLLLKTLLVEAEKHKETVIPAYTHHSQQAQPVTLGHFYMSCFQMFSRDFERILESYKRVNMSTMGGAACATTSFPLNRARVAELLGFDGFLENSMDACATVDFAYEPASMMAIYSNNIGRMAESLLLWNLNEVGISRLAFKYCSYSTIMPQKRNPVSLETLRGASEYAYGQLVTMLTAMKAYPQGNGREPGYVVSGYYNIVERMIEATYLLEGIVRTLEVDKERALKVTADGFSTVTDLADMMVSKYGLSFSAGKKIVGKVVAFATEKGMTVHDINSEFISKIAKETLDIDINMSEEDIKHALDPYENVIRRELPGGPSPTRVQETIDKGYIIVEKFDKEWKERREKLELSKKNLFALADKLVKENL